MYTKVLKEKTVHINLTPVIREIKKDFQWKQQALHKVSHKLIQQKYIFELYELIQKTIWYRI